MTTARPNKSVLAGLQCLHAVASSPRPVGSRELARALGLEHTKVHRALGTLALTGLAERTAGGKYRPGPAIHVLAAQSLHGSGLLQAALPHLRKLKWEGLAVALGVLWRGQVCYLVHARQHHGLEEGIGRHEIRPALRSSLGLILLAQPEASVPADLGVREAAALARARGQGYGLLRSADGEVSVAAAIGRPAYAAIGASARSLGDERIAALAIRLRQCADAIAAALSAGRSS